ncbi:MAG: uracil phosphoribosyltransferase [Croceitalea sp.]|nr:uracil phosphoribosyltransferase [Croceitalea sp.]MBT8239451.1 uracil phosphoribosyltransferase [Croceitalea sp.]NNC33539.1 uracil phosphoribosyltransferase [Croceitalea sp.]NNL07902.1 uracil phosphoribosyltransferase [Croceitalea sp.]NNM17570.1 uracil phosphoribosyltransferase [Croceitalea sp.]
MKAFFYGIEDLFVNGLFAPFDFFRFLESWWTSNTINWLFFVLGAIAMVYWMGELKKFDARGEEDKSITSHSYL